MKYTHDLVWTPREVLTSNTYLPMDPKKVMFIRDGRIRLTCGSTWSSCIETFIPDTVTSLEIGLDACFHLRDPNAVMACWLYDDDPNSKNFRSEIDFFEVSNSIIPGVGCDPNSRHNLRTGYFINGESSTSNDYPVRCYNKYVLNIYINEKRKNITWSLAGKGINSTTVLGYSVYVDSSFLSRPSKLRIGYWVYKSGFQYPVAADRGKLYFDVTYTKIQTA